MKYTDKLGLPVWNKPETDVFDIEQFNEGMKAIDDIVIHILNQINDLVIGDTKVDLNEYVKEKVFEELKKKVENKADKEEVEQISSQLDKKAKKTDVASIQQQVNNLVIESSGDSNPEVVQARGGYKVINDRFKATESAISETKVIEIVKTLGTSKLNNNYGIMIYNDYGASISVNKLFLSVEGNGNVYLYKGIKDTRADGAIGIKDVSLINTYSVSGGENLYDENFDFFSNEAIYLYWDSGVSLKYSTKAVEGIRPSNNYYWTNNNATITTGGSKYMGKTTYPDWVYGVTFGGNYLGLIDFSNYNNINKNIEELDKSFSEIEYTFPTKYDIFQKGINLVNPFDCLYDGYYVDKTTGNLKQYGNYHTSPFIDVIEGESYYIYCSEFYAYYDEDENFIKNDNPIIKDKLFTIPIGKGIKKIRFSSIGATNPSECKLYCIPVSKCSSSKGVRKYSTNLNSLLLPHLAQPFVNKNIVIVGDSYTDQGKYFEWLYTITGANYIGDIGKSGEPLCRFAYNITQNSTLIQKADLVIIVGGTNDYGVKAFNQASNNIVLGNFEDINNARNVEKIISDGMRVLSSSIYVGIKEIIDTITYYNADVPILFVTQPERGNYGGITYAPNPNPLGLTMTNIAEAIKDCTSKLGCDCYDFHAVAWRYTQINKYTDDELHPNSVGGERMGKSIGKYINNSY